MQIITRNFEINIVCCLYTAASCDTLALFLPIPIRIIINCINMCVWQVEASNKEIRKHFSIRGNLTNSFK